MTSPAEGEEREITVPLIRPLTNKSIGSLAFILRISGKSPCL